MLVWGVAWRGERYFRQSLEILHCSHRARNTEVEYIELVKNQIENKGDIDESVLGTLREKP